MLKRSLSLLTLLVCMIPMMAFAGNVSTRVMTTGGNITVNGGAAQTSANGTVTKSFTTAIPVTINPTLGYAVSAVKINGVDQALTSPLNVPLSASTQSVTVSFVRQLVSVTASATSTDGTVSPYGTQSLYANTSATYTFTPNTGKSVVDITGLPEGATLKNSSNVVVTLPYAGQVKATFTVPATPVNIVASFVGIVANAGTPQTVLVNGSSALAGSAAPSAGTTYAWTQVSGPSATITDPTSATSAITFTTAGTYILKLTATNAVGTATATTSLTVTDSAADAALVQCENCHNSAVIGAGNYAAWAASAHATNTVMCYNCHAGANTGAHPGTLLTGSVNEATFNYTGTSNNFCITCHSPAITADFAASPHVTPAGAASCSFCHVQGVHNPSAVCVNCHNPGNPLGLPWPPAGLDFHNDYNGTNLCSNCHKLHNPGIVTGMSGAAHYNNITSAGYPASYVTSKSACTDCHVTGSSNKTIRQQWAQSGHAAFTELPWTDKDFKTRSGCVQCHTTTGFIAYSTAKVTAAWGVDSDKTKEVLTCIGCHSDVAGGIVRTVTPVKPFAADAYVNRNVGTSNICMGCHSGMNNGLSIASADFANQAFIPPHYLTAGGSLHGKSGYNFPGQTYAFYSSNTHRRIGMGNSNGTGTLGPCVACHMSAPAKHLFKAVSTASNGAIGTIAASVCVTCHTSAFDATQLDTKRVGFVNAMDVLKAMLARKGFVYTPDYPYFSRTDWGTDQSGANTMGAAFNYVLLLKEPGAYAHNSAYEKQLIFDSIDYLYNGTITGSIDSAVSSLVDNGITQAQADSLIAYKSSNSCISCHANTSGSHPAHLNSGFSCADCHNDTSATNTTLVSGTTTHLNGVADLQAGLGRSFSYAGGTCSNISCHYNGTATWGGTLGCDGCHGNPPATFSHMKHAGKGVNYSFVCSECHKGNTHANGTFQDVFIDKSGIIAGSAATYTAAIRTCSALYCHSNGTSLATGQPASGSVVWGSNNLACDGCHGNPPAYATGSPKANSHVSHSFGCGFCHAGTTTDGLTISDNSLHSNGVYNVTPGAGVSFTYVFSASGGTCSNISCHNNGTAVWGTTLTCGSCHAESPGGD